MITVGFAEVGNDSGQFDIAAPLDLSKRRLAVLVIEDESSLQVIMERVFKQIDADTEVVWARSAEDGLKLLQARTFDLVISDYYLSGRMTGLNVWTFCKSHMPKMPVFMMSNLSIPSFIELTKNFAEVPPFLPKPFTVGDCRCFVQAYLYGRYL